MAFFFKPNFSLSSAALSFIIKISDGSSLLETPAIIKPSGLTVGRSLCECTARSMVLFKSDSSSSLVKKPLPSSLSKLVSYCCERSPAVEIILISTSLPFSSNKFFV